MKSKVVFPVILIVFCSSFGLFLGCGGGGGSGSSGGAGGSSAKTGVRILHGALDVSPLDLYLSGNPELLQRARFGEPSRYSGLSQGGQVINLTRAFTPGASLFSISLNVSDGQRQSVLVFGNTEAIGVNQVVLNDDPGEIPTGSAALRVVHSAVGAAAISATAGGVEITSNTTFGSASGYVILPAGVLNFSARRVVDGREISASVLTLQSRKGYSVLVAGEVDYLVINPIFEDR